MRCAQIIDLFSTFQLVKMSEDQSQEVDLFSTFQLVKMPEDRSQKVVSAAKRVQGYISSALLSARHYQIVVDATTPAVVRIMDLRACVRSKENACL